MCRNLESLVWGEIELTKAIQNGIEKLADETLEQYQTEAELMSEIAKYYGNLPLEVQELFAKCLCDKSILYRAHFHRNLVSQGRDEIILVRNVIMGFSAAMQCQNVEVVKSFNDKTLKKKKSGNYALRSRQYDLVVKGTRTKLVDLGEMVSGSGAKKRTHWRRRHIRRLSSGKTTIVSQSLINGDQGKAANRTYRVEKQTEVI